MINHHLMTIAEFALFLRLHRYLIFNFEIQNGDQVTT
jgi:hypothetical protein